MLTYDLNAESGMALYECLYKNIRQDILNGILKAGDKLPSKRKMAENHSVSVITVENAYEQLLLEGYIEAVEKKGYYVTDIRADNYMLSAESAKAAGERSKKEEITPVLIDFTKNSAQTSLFPTTVWARLSRKNLLDDRKTLLNGSVKTGVRELKEAVAGHLSGFRGLKVNPDNIIIGAGTEYLYGLIVQLLGRNKMIAVEDPGHTKVSQVYESNGVKVLHIPVDREGLSVNELSANMVSAVHISPSHHFPTGVVMPATRRHELLNWVNEKNCYIIEDDYDSEFRFTGKPIPTMASLDRERVIYMNTFSKTLTSSIRIAYMVLPERLMKVYNERLSFYSCTVSSIEQYTLADFISDGYYERHINRMRNYYKGYRTSIIEAIRKSELGGKIRIEEEDSGLHFLISFNSQKTDDEIISILRYNGIVINSVSSYCYNQYKRFEHKLIINYSDIDAETLAEALRIMNECI